MEDIKNALLDILPIIEKYAPAIASAIGTPSAGLAISLLCELFDADKHNLDDLVHRVINDPSADKKLTDIQQNLFTGVKNIFGSRPPSKATISFSLKWAEE